MDRFKYRSSSSFPDNVPSIVDLAKLYRAAVAGSDLRMAQVAEASALLVAVAEAGLAEAAAMHDFLRESGIA
mgnify:CR=1 FL=1